MITITERIDGFIREMSARIPGITLVVEHDSCDDTYMILHNYKNCRNLEFVDIKSSLMEEYFEEDGIFSVGCSFSSRI